MVDLRDPEAVAFRLEQAMTWLEEAAPPGPPRRIFRRRDAAPVDKLRMPPAVLDLLDELADALADSGPFDPGLSIGDDWLSAHRAADRAGWHMRDDRAALAYREAKKGVRALHRVFTSAAAREARRRAHPLRYATVVGYPTREEELREMAAQAAPNERLLYAHQADNSRYRAILATDRRMLVAERGRTRRWVVTLMDPDQPASAIWSADYADIRWISGTDGLRGFGAGVTFATDAEPHRVSVVEGGKEIGEVLSAILECRRGDRQPLTQSKPRRPD